ncbi:hypothetical protein [Microbacterium sp. VKM Ac-2923]|uniref:hypothetical protein n=1 Tax=Microbacterium sp. VKM Ac-2923 TaxID=2929476 RepID=UPI0035AC0589
MGVITIIALLLAAAAIVGWALSTSFLVGCIALGMWQIGTTTVSLNGIITRQALTPANLQGRVNTTARMIAWGGQPLGAGAAGLLTEGIGVAPALLIAAAVSVITAVVGSALPVGRSATPNTGQDEDSQVFC